jgi:hypothetical protein
MGRIPNELIREPQPPTAIQVDGTLPFIGSTPDVLRATRTKIGPPELDRKWLLRGCPRA